MKSKAIHSKNEDIILSVGMIVKNEEKHLDNCLSALKNLTDHIPSELIIVDTGSTDKTRDIALKYTDKVYDFEWINDFAAARNFGLEKAKGKWFMFLDADEYFDKDCSEMIKFFSYPELYEKGKWKTCTLNFRNHNNKDPKKYNSFYATRLARRTPELKFRGKIHEGLECERFPMGNFSTIVHHYGYNNDVNFMKKKTERNMKLLLEEFENNKEDIHLVGQMIDSSRTLVERNKYIDLILELLDKPENSNNEEINVSLLRAIQFYEGQGLHDKTLKTIDKYFEISKNQDSVVTAAIYAVMANTYTAISEYRKANEAFEKYNSFYKKYQKNELNTNDLLLCGIDDLSESEYLNYQFRYINSLCMTREYEKAHKVLFEIDYKNLSIGDFKNWFGTYATIFENLKNYDEALEICSVAYATKDDLKMKLAVQLLENFYIKNILERESFIDALSASDKKDLPFVNLMRIVKAEKDGKDISDEISAYMNSDVDYKYGYGEAFYLCIKYNVDISDVFTKMTSTEICSNASSMGALHEEYPETALEYCKNNDMAQSIQAMLFSTVLLERAVYYSSILSHEQKGELYDLFIYTLSDYIFNIYNPELLNVEDADVLPELHRFGYYMTLAFTAKNDGDSIGYIRCLKEALRLCEPMKDLVSYYLDEFQNELAN